MKAFYLNYKTLFNKSHKSTHMGVSKGEEGVGDRPRTGGGLWFWAKEVLIGSGGLGVSRNFPENLPPQALLSPFPPFFSPRLFSANLFIPQNPSLTSLDQVFSPFLPLLPAFFSLRPFPGSLRLFLSHDRITSEHLRNPSLNPFKVLKSP